MVEVKKACVRDLFQEWATKTTDSVCLDDSQYQAYIILNLCRILYSIMQRPTGSKKLLHHG
ncbi:MAG: hypothetical protein ACYC2U_05745 [Candidatus Amoebophilus sp.]